MSPGLHSRPRQTAPRLLTTIVAVVSLVIGGALAYALWGNQVGIASAGSSITSGNFSLALNAQGWQWTAPGHLAPGQSATATHDLVFEGAGANLRTNLTVRPAIVPTDPGTAPLPHVAWAVVPQGQTPTESDYHQGVDTLLGIEPGNYVVYVKFSVLAADGLPNGRLEHDELVNSVALTLTAEQTRTVAQGGGNE